MLFLDPTGRLRILWRLGLFVLGFGMIQIAVAVAVALAGIVTFILVEGHSLERAADVLGDAEVLVHLQMLAARRAAGSPESAPVSSAAQPC